MDEPTDSERRLGQALKIALVVTVTAWIGLPVAVRVFGVDIWLAGVVANAPVLAAVWWVARCAAVVRGISTWEAFKLGLPWTRRG